MEFTHNVIADIATALHITDQHVLEPLPDSWRSEAWDFTDQFTDEYCPLALLEDELVDATDLLDICQTAKNLGVI